jgi:hypothetical protein
MTRIPFVSAVVCLLSIGCADGVPTTPTSAIGGPSASNMTGVTSHATDGTQPVRLVQGEIEVGPWYDRQSATLRGTDGFRFDALLGNSEYPGQICIVDPLACRAGETVPLSGQWGGSDLSGTVKWRGETITNVGLETGAFMSLTGSFVAPAQAETATVVTPFVVAGFIETPAGVTVPFEGKGIATVDLQWDTSAGDPGNWLVVGTRLEFKGAH